MGRKGGFFTALKKIVSCGSKQGRKKRTHSPENWLEHLDLVAESSAVAPAAPAPVEEAKLTEVEDESNRHAYSVAIATAVAAEAAVAAAQAAAEVVRLTSSSAQFTARTKEELAAVKIQTAFRGYMARRALRALKGLVRLKSLVGGQSVKRQSAATLKCMQTLSRVQFEIRSRRLGSTDENMSLQRQIQLKHEKELEKQKVSIGENWDDSTKSKEQVEANIQSRQEAAVRRERALAYAYLHQQTRRNTTTTPKQTFMDPNNPRWGWSWLERWMANPSRPFDTATPDKEQASDRASAISSSSITKPRPASRQSPSTPNSKPSGRRRPPSPRGSTNGRDDDSRSINSIQSERCRRHSIAGSSVRDDNESLASCPAGSGRRYMASTVSTRAKSRPPSPLGRTTPDKASSPAGSAVKKRLSFSMSPDRRRRHSGPPKIDISPLEDSNR